MSKSGFDTAESTHGVIHGDWPDRRKKWDKNAMHLLLVLGAVLVLVGLAPPASKAQGYADMVLVHGKVWTENPLQPEAQAIAIEGNRIMAVGDSDAILKLAGRKTKVVELNGRRVVPGFNDAHVHFYMGGDGLASVHLHEASSPEEFRQKIASFARPRRKANGS